MTSLNKALLVALLTSTQLFCAEAGDRAPSSAEGEFFIHKAILRTKGILPEGPPEEYTPLIIARLAGAEEAVHQCQVADAKRAAEMKAAESK